MSRTNSSIVLLATAAISALLVAGLPTAAYAAGAGIGDVSDAMLYDGTTAPLGSVIEDLRNEDDDTHTIAISWPLNFFGEVYGALCVTTNGGVFPVIDDSEGCSDNYDETLAYLAEDAGSPFIGVLAGDINLEYIVEDVDGNPVADDGFGEPGNIYFADTTIDGIPAIVVTWYRVQMYDEANSDQLANTFQLVFLQRPTVDGATLGYDFDVQFNFGTMQDAENGYEPEVCTVTADENCYRWGIGWADFDVDTSTATGYELFPNSPTTALIDPGFSPLVQNHLNSPGTLGRYQFAMVGGVTTGFSVPQLTDLRPAPPQLAATGAETGLLVSLALALLATGALVLTARRRATV